MSILTVRLIKSFEYRTIKNVVMHNLDLDNLTVRQFIELIQRETQKFAPYKNNKFDTLKVYYHPHGMKPNHLVINLETDDDFLTDLDKTLTEYGLVPETELSFFNMAEYTHFKENPEMKW
eukprot:CAMPEP_0184335586 /NCGR_PEP_ID=MMETSP1089-20130417/4129_1 /TAXON_ID=38269 ORGANISM="Gloeochaete wittrockiana, Strain SAG46.84" /NCGR_SAMPLE_ID=MMETSP1089 /ASSEMBLY_ACC=CAM_ASM_000445 /LENGTH=119 /DNA_ID=CAMNT_0026660319 /DNA_START=50 /DNA_END=406 /DNA_ORIENTATION=+